MKMGCTLCAFSNSRGGWQVVGTYIVSQPVVRRRYYLLYLIYAGRQMRRYMLH